MKSTKRSVIGYVTGVCTVILIVLSVVAILSKGMVDSLVGSPAAEYIITGTLIVAALIGNMITLKLSEGKSFVTTCILVSSIAVLLLLCGLMIDGKFQNVAIRLCSIAAGATVSYILCQRNNGKMKKMKRRYR